MSGWPRGPPNELHYAARRGSTERTVDLLSDGSVDIDQGDPEGRTPLMACCAQGYVRVARILLRKGANMSIADGAGLTALHTSAGNGHVAVTKLLARAGAGLEASDKNGFTPLHRCSHAGRTGTMSALLEAGADPNSLTFDQATPLACAVSEGHLDAVKLLLRAKANPLLAIGTSGGGRSTVGALDMAVDFGYVDVVRELIQQVGIEACAGIRGGGFTLLCRAARWRSAKCVDIMAILIDAGVVDTGDALCEAAGHGHEKAVKFLLQQQQHPTKTWEASGGVAYVNANPPGFETPLLSAINCSRSHPRVVQMLVDAGADTTSAVQVKNLEGKPLDHVNDLLREQKAKEETDEAQLNRLEAIRRMLMSVEAIHAVSWLWPEDAPSVVDDDADDARRTKGTSTAGTPLMLALPTLKRRARERGVIWAPLFRYSAKPWEEPEVER